MTPVLRLVFVAGGSAHAAAHDLADGGDAAVEVDDGLVRHAVAADLPFFERALRREA
ncbi:hypothetical protein [Jiella avicenniae]|uniref:Uncharacterized protein n=1 Tax=Jiella avicenniae TaxID=2907202 RepID=A0A9X1P5J2_9HYPH|nr:hypothetical protein [Jiella avicenniae]MCE7030179.1 hypothetical protein [Jiella avicenniae]